MNAITLNTLFGSILLTTLTYAVGLAFGWIPLDLSWLALLTFVGVVLNYACVWLVGKQEMTTWPIGIAAAILLSIVFWEQKFYASFALNLLYFVPVQIWGWYHWKRGTERKTLELGHLSLAGYVGLGFAAVIVWAAVTWLHIQLGGALSGLDSAILVGSILAQYLMTTKKIESWVLWILVNIASIVVYFSTPATFLVGFQYVFFLANAFYGAYQWRAGVRDIWQKWRGPRHA